MKYLGNVVWFDIKKGYGFINYNSKDIFVHFSDIAQKGFKELKKDQLVEFEIGKNYYDQLKAVEVKIID